MSCLVVEDDPDLSFALRCCLENLGVRVEVAQTLAAAYARLKVQKYDLLILDYQLPDGDSLALSEYAAATHPNLRTLMLTGSGVFPHGELRRIAPQLDWIMRKPVPMQDVAALADYATQGSGDPQKASA